MHIATHAHDIFRLGISRVIGCMRGGAAAGKVPSFQKPMSGQKLQVCSPCCCTYSVFGAEPARVDYPSPTVWLEEAHP